MVILIYINIYIYGYCVNSKYSYNLNKEKYFILKFIVKMFELKLIKI